MAGVQVLTRHKGTRPRDSALMLPAGFSEGEKILLVVAQDKNEFLRGSVLPRCAGLSRASGRPWVCCGDAGDGQGRLVVWRSKRGTRGHTVRCGHAVWSCVGAVRKSGNEGCHLWVLLGLAGRRVALVVWQSAVTEGDLLQGGRVAQACRPSFAWWTTRVWVVNRTCRPPCARPVLARRNSIPTPVGRMDARHFCACFGCVGGSRAPPCPAHGVCGALCAS